MKHLVLILLLALPAFSLADTFKLQESLFTIDASLKTAQQTVPAFKLNGSALWMESDVPYESPKAEITIRRKTYECDLAYHGYNDDYECEIYGAKMMQILNDIANYDPNFIAAKNVIERYFDRSYSYEKFTIPLGKGTQGGQSTDSMTDPKSSRTRVEFTLTNTGMKPL